MATEETFHVGALFDSMKQLKTTLQELELKTGEKFIIKNGRKFAKDAECYEQLEYRYIHYWCNRSGTFTPSGLGIRNTNSQKINCPAYIKIKGVAERQCLEITEQNLHHNHTLLKIGDTTIVTELSKIKDNKVSETHSISMRRATLEPVMHDLLKLLIDSPNDDMFTEGLHAVTNILKVFQFHCNEPNKQEEPDVEKSTDFSSKIESLLSIELRETSCNFVAAESIERQDRQSANRDCNDDRNGDDLMSSAQKAADQQIVNSEIDEDTSVTVADVIERSAGRFAKPVGEVDSAVIILQDGDEDGEQRSTSSLASTGIDDFGIEGKSAEDSDEASPIELSTTVVSRRADKTSSMCNFPEDSDAHGRDQILVAKKAVHEAPEVDLTSVVMPVKVRGKGRPKGTVLTAIGLPRKQDVLSKFSEKSDAQKVYDIMGWLINTAMINIVMKGEHTICKKDLNLKTLRDSIVDEAVDLNLLSRYFEAQAFASLKKAVDKKKRDNILTCRSCEQRIVDKSVECDHCLMWYHYSCVQLKRAPRAQTWFCFQCKPKK